MTKFAIQHTSIWKVLRFKDLSHKKIQAPKRFQNSKAQSTVGFCISQESPFSPMNTGFFVHITSTKIWTQQRQFPCKFFLGRMNMLMVQVGMAWTMNFNKTSLPACDKKIFFQLLTQAQTRFLIASNVRYLLFVTFIGKPRYFS